MAQASSKQFALLGKAQAAANTPVALTGAAHIHVIGKPKFTPDFTELESDEISQMFGKGQSKIIGKAMKLGVECYLRAGGGLGVRPDFAPLIECANHNVVSTAGVKVVISPITGLGSSRKTSTFAWYEDGLKWAFENAMFTGLALESAMDGFYKFKGSIIAPFKAYTEASVPVLSAQAMSPEIACLPSDVVTEGGVDIPVGNITFDTTGSCAERRMIGLEEVHMDARDKPMATFSKASLGTITDYTRLLNAQNVALISKFGTAGNRVTLNIPDGQVVSLAPEDDGVHVNRAVGIAARGGDNAYTITID